ncbi:MAG: hypothetical protein LBU51_06890 [Bacteroidales bacterium]|jgi:hypothetical protein|nr:hypothetical protein [Bacteroidales bacterium]
MKKLALIVMFLTLGFAVTAQSPAVKIKKIIDELEFKNKVDDHSLDTIYTELNKQISTSTGVEKAIWNSLKAEFLQNYCSRNRYDILDRTPIAGEQNPDFTTWDIQTLEKEITNHYVQSLGEPQLLQNTPITEFKILMDTMLSVEYRPTLYDFLAFRALDYFTDRYYDLIRFSDFDNHNIILLQDNSAFLGYVPINAHPLDVSYLTFKLFQKITAFHSADLLPCIDVTLRRLSFYYGKNQEKEVEECYLKTLLALENKFAQQAGYEDIVYALGTYYQTRADKYDKTEHPEYQFDYKTAIAWYQKAIDFAPKSLGGQNAEVRINNIKNKTLSISLPNGTLLIPNQQNLLTCSYQNCDSIYFRMIQLTEQEYQELQQKGHNTTQQSLWTFPVLKEWFHVTIPIGDYREQTGHILLPSLPIGRYVLISSPTPFSQMVNDNVISLPFLFLHVSNIKVTFRTINTGIELMINDRKTGKPIPNATILCNIYENSSATIIKTDTIITDKKGQSLLHVINNGHVTVAIITPKEEFVCDKHFDVNIYREEELPQMNSYIFTDRSIYRPGQTVYFKGITVETYHKTHQLKQNLSVKVSLKNYSNEIASTMFITNDFGSFTGSFEIPNTIKTGLYNIYSDKGGNGTKISIEEYKRPQFEVAIDKPETSYKLGEEVAVTGKALAYAGYPIDGATVNYRITRKYFLPCFWRNNYSYETQISTGTSTTDHNGEFSLSFVALADQADMVHHPLYQYVISADITDINNETQSSVSSILIGNESMFLELEMPTIVATDDPQKSFPIAALNMNRKPQSANITYKIIALETPKDFLFEHNRQEKTTVTLTNVQILKKTLPFIDFENTSDRSKWKETVVISSGTIKYPQDSLLNIPNLSNLKEGYYKISLFSKDTYNNEITLEKTILIYDKKSKKCNAYQPIFLTIDKTTAQPEDEISIMMGSYLKKANVFFEIFLNDSLQSSQWIYCNTNKVKFSYQIPKEGYGTLKVHAFVVQNNFVAEETLYTSVPNKTKIIEAEWLSFRDKTLPGSKETWTLKLKNISSETLLAEVLATMYDASLDAFKAHHFDFNLPTIYSNRSIVFQNHEQYFYPRDYYRSNQRFRYDSERRYYEISTSLFDKCHYGDRNIMFAAADNGSLFDVEYEEPLYNRTTSSVRLERMPAPKNETISDIKMFQSIRQNFNETAFFYPKLRSDDEGNIAFSFTMPDALTKWKFLGLAHTKELKIGIFEKIIQTQKPLMVVPNLPRFFRENDTLTISAKVVNMSEESLQGKVTLELTNTLTGMPLNIVLDKFIAIFNAKKGESAEVSFRIAIPYQLEAVSCKIFASAETANPDDSTAKILFFDGEEKVIPVLSNRMLVTETMPVFANTNQKKSFTFVKLKNNHSSSLQHFKFTLEVTSNPLWYAVMALPYLMSYSYDCNEQIFSKLYANSIAVALANSSPKIKEVFDTWKNSTPSTLCSNLEKNEELKNILLAETPWINQAQSENQQRQQIAELFDQNRVGSECTRWAFQLTENQNADGGWSWFKGGLSNLYITQHIIAGFGHLQTMDITTQLNKNTLHNAIRYVDNEQLKIYKDRKSKNDKYPEDSYFNQDMIHYLYAKTLLLDAVKDSKETTDLLEVYTRHIQKIWSKQSYYMQGMIALTLWHSGDHTTATKIVESLKTHAQYSEELGMFWKKEGYGCYWQDAQIERQALLIEAFSLITKDQKSVEKMQQWLLKQKQTQNWNTTKSTSEACYALLLNNTAQLETIPEMTVSVGDQTFDLTKQKEVEAGTGYFKTSWDGSEINNKFADIKIDKTSKGIAWGAAYWQYFEDMDKLTAANTALIVTKKLYLVENQDHRETLIPITEHQPIIVGDRVRVVIELSSDRNMEFLHLKDMRAAAFEPVNVLSGYKQQGNLWYYESTRDAATNFFIDYLPKGKYVFEYTLIASQAGTFSNGIATLQCMYAPEFSAHSEGIKVKITAK